MPHSDRYQAGLTELDEVDGPPGRRVVSSLEQVAPDLARYIVEFGFGEVYRGRGFDRRSREITTIAALTSLGGCEPQLAVHVGAGLNVGLSPHEIVAAMTHACFYAGFPRAINAVRVAEKVFDERGIDPANAAIPQELARKFVTAMADHDVKTALSVLSQDAVIVAPGDPAQVPWAGMHNGIREIAEFLYQLVERVTLRQPEIRMTVPAGENVLVVGRHTGVSRESGHTVYEEFVLHFTVRAGRISRCHIYTGK